MFNVLLQNNRSTVRMAQRGFTLIEILVVVLIISILAGIVGVSVLRHPGEAKVTAANL